MNGDAALLAAEIAALANRIILATEKGVPAQS